MHFLTMKESTYQNLSISAYCFHVQAQPTYLRTCLWLLAFLVFGYALATMLKSIVLKFFYDIEREKKEQMYRELAVMREERHKENETA